VRLLRRGYAVLIVGNSGSGKSHQAKALASEHGLVHLDLDTIYFEPGTIAVARSTEDVRADLHAFVDVNPRWVIEGCYGDVIAAALPFCTELIFMNPGKEVCLANNEQRPHKFASKKQQDSMLPFLLDWVGKYYERTDNCSYAVHHAMFDAFAGAKREATASC
jgi:adenylate kinase family enzyme